MGRPIDNIPLMNGDWHCPEPMSTDPTLMFSLEKPLPLREPVEDTDCFYRES